MKPIKFSEAFRFWAKLGCISFGGPAGQIAIMQTELVDRKKWIDQGSFLRGLNFCMLLPGPEAQQLATYIGWRMHGWRGAITAGSLFVLPGTVILWFLSWIAASYGNLGIVAAIFTGIKPIVVAIVVHAVFRIGKRALQGWPAFSLAAGAFGLIFWGDIDFPWIVLGAGMIGWISAHAPNPPFMPQHHGEISVDTNSGRTNGWYRAIGLIALFAVLWMGGVSLVLIFAGPDPFLNIATFFTKAAFVTFGGAYAVLPYIADKAVTEFQWLDTGQMLNGLALAETTPGPLILVTEYVGYFAGFNHSGQLTPPIAGALGATLTVYVTFLPSIFFILLGAPYVARIGAHRYAGAALSAITAAVVGVILNLAVFIGLQVFFPLGRLDFSSFLAAAVALGLLMRFQLPIHWLILLGAGFGLAQWWGNFH